MLLASQANVINRLCYQLRRNRSEAWFVVKMKTGPFQCRISAWVDQKDCLEVVVVVAVVVAVVVVYYTPIGIIVTSKVLLFFYLLPKDYFKICKNVCKRKRAIWNWNLQKLKSFVAASNLLEELTLFRLPLHGCIDFCNSHVYSCLWRLI